MIIDAAELYHSVDQAGFISYFVRMIPPIDRAYYVPALSNVIDEVAASRVRIADFGLVYKDEIGDCDDFAWIMSALIKAQAWKDEERRHQWPFGFALATHPFGHAFNICFTRDAGWVEIEPQPGGAVLPLEVGKYSGYYLMLF